MVHNKNKLAVAVLLAAGLASTSVLAAEVPAGTQLAEVQKVVKGNGAEPATLDPHKIEGHPESNIARDLFEGLVIQNGQGDILPGVAEKWEVNGDNTVFTFHLRKDAKWSNGDTVTAGDFVFGWQRAVDPATASPYAWYVEYTSMANASDIIAGKKPASELGVKAIDDHTLEVTLSKPVPYFIRMLAHTTMVPAHKATIEAHGDKWTSPENFVGNGAFKLKDWVVNERIVLERNTNYWDNAKTVINEVTYLPIESQNSELARYKAGEVDLTNEIAIEHFKTLQKEIPNEVKVTGQIGTYYYQFNTQKAPFDDIRVRKALSLSIDRDIIVDKVMGQGQIAAYNFTPDITAGFTPETPQWAGMTQEQRNEMAKKLLEEAGFGPGKPLSFELLYNTSENHKKVALAISSMWKKNLGVNVDLVNQEWKTYLETKKNGQFSVARAGWIGDYNEASTMLDLLTSAHGNNDGKYSNAEYDKLLSDSKAIVDENERASYYNKAEKILARDMPVAPIYQYVTARLVKPYVGGYPTANPEDMVYSKDLYIIAH